MKEPRKLIFLAAYVQSCCLLLLLLPLLRLLLHPEPTQVGSSQEGSQGGSQAAKARQQLLSQEGREGGEKQVGNGPNPLARPLGH